MNPALYRKWIRQVIAIDAPYPCSERALQDGVKALLGGGRFDLSLYRDAMEWNLSKDYIRAGDDADTDQKVWRLTPLGKAKQDSE